MMRNEKGVVIKVRSTAVGVDLNFGAKGLEVSLANRSAASGTAIDPWYSGA